MATVSAIILYIMNSTLFIVILALTIINATLIYIFKEPYKKINLKQMEAGARLNSHIIESLKGVETLKVLSAEDKTIEKLEIEYIKNLKITFKEGVLSNIQGSGAVVTAASVGLISSGLTVSTAAVAALIPGIGWAAAGIIAANATAFSYALVNATLSNKGIDVGWGLPAGLSFSIK